MPTDRKKMTAEEIERARKYDMCSYRLRSIGAIFNRNIEYYDGAGWYFNEQFIGEDAVEAWNTLIK
jgi:hypothetical protein